VTQEAGPPVALEVGNANDAGAASRGWFVGDLAAWAVSRGASLDLSATPRQSSRIEVKWLVHPAGDRRAGWAERDRSFALSVLVDGEMRLDFRALDGDVRPVHLTRPGDYVIWHGPTYSHVWWTDAGCTMLTVRWQADVERR
jgi:hypothetical protein